MVNFQNPVTFAREFGACALSFVWPTGDYIYRRSFSTAATVNLWHTTDGIFM